jgi:hypothetical protein
MMPTGSDVIWLEVPEKLKGLTEFTPDLPGINTPLTNYEASEPIKKSTKETTYVRRKPTGGDLF